MTAKDIKRLTHRVTDYLCRVTLQGQATVTIWYGNVVDTIFVTDENKEALEELMYLVDLKKNGQDR